MPYHLHEDEVHDDPIWDVLSGGSDLLADRLLAAYFRLSSRASHIKRDGYVTERIALDSCRRRRGWLSLFVTPVLEGRVLLHRPGDECSCLGPDPWIEGYQYRIHGFLKRNPSRREYDRNRAQKADLRDARLKQGVYDRDGGCCRYCRSGPLSPKAGRSTDRRRVLSHDHVDPDRPAGDDGANLVIACGRCNDQKGRRTPDEADMTLLPAPTRDQAAQWLTAEPARRDRPHRREQTPDQRPNSDETATEQPHDADPNTDRPPEPDADPPLSDLGEPRPEHGTTPTETAPFWPGKGPNSGRVGEPVPDPTGQPPDTPRSSLHPDIYHHRSRAPTSPQPRPPPPRPPQPRPPPPRPPEEGP